MIVATGGRGLAWPLQRIEAQLLAAAADRPVAALFHGHARGADALADQAARRLGWPVRPTPAQWSLHGMGAGPIRNRQMLEAAIEQAAALEPRGSVVVLAFPGGRGTAHCIQEARRLRRCSGQPIEVLFAAV